MSDAPLTIAALFGLDAEQLAPAAAAALRATVPVQLLIARIGIAGDGGVWSSVERNVARALQAALEVPLSSVLVRGWNTYRELHKYTDRAKYPPDTPITHTLHEHRLRFTQHPRVELTFQGVPLDPDIIFDLNLDANIKSAELSIRAGRIIEARVGPCRLSGELKLGDAKLSELSIPEYRFPAAIPFGEGILIAEPDAAEPAPGR